MDTLRSMLVLLSLFASACMCYFALGPPRVTLFGLRNRRPIKSHVLRCHSSSTEWNLYG